MKMALRDTDPLEVTDPSLDTPETEEEAARITKIANSSSSYFTHQTDTFKVFLAKSTGHVAKNQQDKFAAAFNALKALHLQDVEPDLLSASEWKKLPGNNSFLNDI